MCGSQGHVAARGPGAQISGGRGADKGMLLPEAWVLNFWVGVELAHSCNLPEAWVQNILVGLELVHSRSCPCQCAITSSRGGGAYTYGHSRTGSECSTSRRSICLLTHSQGKTRLSAQSLICLLTHSQRETPFPAHSLTCLLNHLFVCSLTC